MEKTSGQVKTSIRTPRTLIRDLCLSSHSIVAHSDHLVAVRSTSVLLRVQSNDKITRGISRSASSQSIGKERPARIGEAVSLENINISRSSLCEFVMTITMACRAMGLSGRRKRQCQNKSGDGNLIRQHPVFSGVKTEIKSGMRRMSGRERKAQMAWKWQ